MEEIPRPRTCERAEQKDDLRLYDGEQAAVPVSDLLLLLLLRRGACSHCTRWPRRASVLVVHTCAEALSRWRMERWVLVLQSG